MELFFFLLKKVITCSKASSPRIRTHHLLPCSDSRICPIAPCLSCRVPLDETREKGLSLSVQILPRLVKTTIPNCSECFDVRISMSEDQSEDNVKVNGIIWHSVYSRYLYRLHYCSISQSGLGKCYYPPFEDGELRPRSRKVARHLTPTDFNYLNPSEDLGLNNLPKATQEVCDRAGS